MVGKILSFRALLRKVSCMFCASFSIVVLWPGLGSLSCVVCPSVESGWSHKLMIAQVPMGLIQKHRLCPLPAHGATGWGKRGSGSPAREQGDEFFTVDSAGTIH